MPGPALHMLLVLARESVENTGVDDSKVYLCKVCVKIDDITQLIW